MSVALVRPAPKPAEVDEALAAAIAQLKATKTRRSESEKALLAVRDHAIRQRQSVAPPFGTDADQPYQRLPQAAIWRLLRPGPALMVDDQGLARGDATIAVHAMIVGLARGQRAMTSASPKLKPSGGVVIRILSNR